MYVGDYSVDNGLSRADGRQERWATFEDAAEAQGFAMIPNAVLRNPRVGMAAKTLYALLKSFAWQDPFCYPGQQRLADDLGVHRNTVGKLLKELDSAGLIRSERRGLNRTNLYTFTRVRPHGLPDAHPSVQPDATPTVQDEDAGNEDAGNEEGTLLLDSSSGVGGPENTASDPLLYGREDASSRRTFSPETEEAMRVIYSRLKAVDIKVPRWCYAAMKCDLERGWYQADDPEYLSELLIEHYGETAEVDHVAAWIALEDL